MPVTKNERVVTANNLFSGIKPTQLKFKFNPKSFIEFKEGDIIYQSGDSSDFAYLIIDGEVKVKFSGTRSSLGVLKKGKNEFFGEKEILEATKRITSAVADSDCVLYKIKNKEITTLAGLHKQIKINSGKANELPEDAGKPSTMGLEGKESIYNLELERKTIRLEDISKKTTETKSQPEDQPEPTSDDEPILLPKSDGDDFDDIIIEEVTEAPQEEKYSDLTFEEIESDEKTEPVDSEPEPPKDTDDFVFSESPEEQEHPPVQEDVIDDISPEEIIPVQSVEEESVNSDYSADAEVEEESVFPDLSDDVEIDEQEFLNWDVDNTEVEDLIMDDLNEDGNTEKEKPVPSVKSIPAIDYLNLNNDGLRICSIIDPVKIKRETLNLLTHYTGAERGIIYVIDLTGSELIAELDSPEGTKKIRVRVGTGPIGTAARNNTIINIKDTSADNRFPDGIDRLTGYEVKNTLIFPAADQTGKVNAVIHLYNSSKGEFTDVDEQVLTRLAPFVATAVSNAAEMDVLLHKNTLASLGKIANFLIPDIKSPILTIKHYASLVKKKKISAEIISVLEMLTEQANIVADFVQTTFDFSQGKEITKPDQVSFNETMDNILRLLSEYVESRNVKLFKKFDQDVNIYLDKSSFYQACFQIAKNSCDAMPTGGNLFISTWLSGSNVKIEIKDEGKGIPESIRKEIFESFFSYGKKNATGIGLSIAKKIIEEHSGSIDFSSRTGEGSVFTISLPFET